MGWTKGYNKYSAKKTSVAGVTFDSRREADRYRGLLLLERSGAIRGLILQPAFEVVPKQKDERAVKYIADFQYVDVETGKTIVEDVKGMRTRDYIIKRKLFKLQNPDIEFREV